MVHLYKGNHVILPDNPRHWFTQQGLEFIELLYRFPTDGQRQNDFLLRIHQHNPAICNNLRLEMIQMKKDGIIEFKTYYTLSSRELGIVFPISVMSPFISRYLSQMEE